MRQARAQAGLPEEAFGVPVKPVGVLRQDDSPPLPLLGDDAVRADKQAFGPGDFFESGQDGDLRDVARKLFRGRGRDPRVVQKRIHRVLFYE